MADHWQEAHSGQETSEVNIAAHYIQLETIMAPHQTMHPHNDSDASVTTSKRLK